MIKLLVNVCLITSLFSCCRGDNAVNLKNRVGNKSVIDHMILFSEDSATKGTRKTLFLQNVAKHMQLPSLFDIKDSFRIRIWLWGDSESFVVDINDQKQTIVCSIKKFKTAMIDSSEYILIRHEWNDLRNKSGRETFLSALKKYKILNNKSGKSFEEVSNILTRMSYVQFEIAEPDEYRYYEYLEPSYFRFVDKGSNDVYQFLRFLNRELNIEIYQASEKLFVKPK